MLRVVSIEFFFTNPATTAVINSLKMDHGTKNTQLFLLRLKQSLTNIVSSRRFFFGCECQLKSVSTTKNHLALEWDMESNQQITEMNESNAIWINFHNSQIRISIYNLHTSTNLALCYLVIPFILFTRPRLSYTIYICVNSVNFDVHLPIQKIIAVFVLFVFLSPPCKWMGMQACTRDRCLHVNGTFNIHDTVWCTRTHTHKSKSIRICIDSFFLVRQRHIVARPASLSVCVCVNESEISNKITNTHIHTDEQCSTALNFHAVRIFILFALFLLLFLFLSVCASCASAARERVSSSSIRYAARHVCSMKHTLNGRSSLFHSWTTLCSAYVS